MLCRDYPSGRQCEYQLSLPPRWLGYEHTPPSFVSHRTQFRQVPVRQTDESVRSAPPDTTIGRSMCKQIERALLEVRGGSREAQWWRRRGDEHLREDTGSDAGPHPSPGFDTRSGASPVASPGPAASMDVMGVTPLGGPLQAVATSRSDEESSDGGPVVSLGPEECWDFNRLRREVRREAVKQGAQTVSVERERHGSLGGGLEREPTYCTADEPPTPLTAGGGRRTSTDAEQLRKTAESELCGSGDDLRLLSQFSSLLARGEGARVTGTTGMGGGEGVAKSYGSKNKHILALLQFKEEMELKKEAQEKQEQMRLRLRNMEQQRREQYQERLRIPEFHFAPRPPAPLSARAPVTNH
eukprot:Hpha_TRINITY_DN30450_c0_g1::TRINITY_DN30450_c0_g1_i1::g.167963::m.167963